MSTALEDTVRHLEMDFLHALRGGESAMAAFRCRLDTLRQQLQSLASSGSVPPHLEAVIADSLRHILAQADTARSFHAQSEGVLSTPSSDDDLPAEAMSQLSAQTTLPLYRYFLSNIACPYPGLEEKERLVAEVRETGSRDFDKKKLEDWLNRKRNQSGFVSILQRYCDNDREAMYLLCRTALFGSTAEQARLPDGALEEVEDMRDYMQSQYEELAHERGVTWVDELATGLRAVLDERDVDDEDSEDDFCSDDDADSSASSSDVASDWSDTDVEEEDDGEPCTIIGAKRKLLDDSLLSPSAVSHPPSRSLSMASSSSSSSGTTACSLRSFSGSSMSSMTSVEWEDDVCHRPSKRIRRESSGFDTESRPSSDSSEDTSPTTTLPTNPLFTAYQIRRKRGGGLDADARTRSMKRLRYASLGVATQATYVPDVHLASLSELCTLDWTPVEVAACDFAAGSYTVDCTQSNDASENEDFAIFAREDETADGTPTWSKLQIDAILRMLVSASDQLPPASLTQSEAYTYAFDDGTLGADNVIDLEEMMKLTPEAFSAMFDAMNGLTPAPAPAEEAVVSAQILVRSADAMSSAPEVAAQETAVPSSDDVLLPVEAASPTEDVLRPLDVPSPVTDAPGRALDVFVSTVTTPALTVDTSASALEAAVSETEEPLGPPEELLSPTSSSSSEGDSPPALSDDSGSSSRCSSVESDNEQDSLLLSPAALSADYTRLTDELSAGKASNADPSQLQVELGVVPEVTPADELSCASELLERYLNDQTIWA